MTALEIGGLYIMLFARAIPDEYHWALYHHWSPHRGTKFHIRNLGEGWIVEHAVVSDAPIQLLLAGFLKIASVRPEDKEVLHDLIAPVTHDVPNVTCRTWILDAVQACIVAGLVRCASLADLESEAKAFGFVQFEDTVSNVQPRPIAVSKRCSL
ncbi:hypothetical protein EW146_g8671 [Bondarzewia mesenterica]|uniref:Uncharacterized protein n=1 Tax=Bondarzewia mesenterica TaxID=1095465 RepID=A0A4S4LD03_9AGAM|nr:hypothetical protein EW146_g8671 [Bondarzewia mesenterica]